MNLTTVTKSATLPKVLTGYNPAVDYLRFFAALFIVQFHAGGPFKPLGPVAAVGFFAIILVWFTISGLERTQTAFGPYLRKRAVRLIYPFFVWAGLHLLAKAASGGFVPSRVWAEWQVYFPPQGSFGQLWFLPWALLVTLGLGSVFWNKGVALTRGASAVAATTITILVTALCLSFWTFANASLIVRLAVLYIPSVLNTAVLYALRDRPDLFWAAVLALSLACLGMLSIGLEGGSQTFIALPLAALALTVRLPVSKGAKQMGTMSMDIYLNHILLIAVLGGLFGLDMSTWAGTIAIWSASLGLALVMQIDAIGRHLR